MWLCALALLAFSLSSAWGAEIWSIAPEQIPEFLASRRFGEQVMADPLKDAAGRPIRFPAIAAQEGASTFQAVFDDYMTMTGKTGPNGKLTALAISFAVGSNGDAGLVQDAASVYGQIAVRLIGKCAETPEDQARALDAFREAMMYSSLWGKKTKTVELNDLALSFETRAKPWRTDYTVSVRGK